MSDTAIQFSDDDIELISKILNKTISELNDRYILSFDRTKIFKINDDVPINTPVGIFIGREICYNIRCHVDIKSVTNYYEIVYSNISSAFIDYVISKLNRKDLLINTYPVYNAVNCTVRVVEDKTITITKKSYEFSHSTQNIFIFGKKTNITPANEFVSSYFASENEKQKFVNVISNTLFTKQNYRKNNLVIFHGDGANGKTTMVKFIGDLLGNDYCDMYFHPNKYGDNETLYKKIMIFNQDIDNNNEYEKIKSIVDSPKFVNKGLTFICCTNYIPSCMSNDLENNVKNIEFIHFGNKFKISNCNLCRLKLDASRHFLQYIINNSGVVIKSMKGLTGSTKLKYFSNLKKDEIEKIIDYAEKNTVLRKNKTFGKKNIKFVENTDKNTVKNTDKNTVKNTDKNTVKNTDKNTVKNTDKNTVKNDLYKLDGFIS